jgi:uncharacterized membrane protein
MTNKEYALLKETWVHNREKGASVSNMGYYVGINIITTILYLLIMCVYLLLILPLYN